MTHRHIFPAALAALATLATETAHAQCSGNILVPLTSQPDDAGANVATDGDRLAVTASSLIGVGSVSLYIRAGSGWVPEVELEPLIDPALGSFHNFRSVDVRGDVVAAGYGLQTGVEQVAIFEFDGQSWSQAATLDRPASAGPPDRFGSAVEIGTGDLLVGRFLYSRGGAGWSLAETLAEATPAAASPRQSRWTAMGDDWIFIGDPTLGGGFRGGVHAFQRTVNGAVFIETLVDVTPSLLEQFGSSMALDDNLLVVGAEGYGSILGFATTYEFDGTTWQRLGGLGSPQPRPFEQFSREIALSDGRLAISSLDRCYYYERVGGDWVPVSATLNGRMSVDLSGDTVLFGRTFTLPIVAAEVDSFRGGQVSMVCSGTPNSTGATARLDARGSLRTSDASLLMTLVDAPANTVGLFVHGPAAGSLPIGNGVLCIDPAAGISRLPGIVSTDGVGHASRVIDPAAFGAAALQGQSVIVQFWFRDVGGAGTDWSDALAVVLCN